MAKVRLGLSDVALARPLTWAAKRGELADLFEVSVVPQRRVAVLLRERALDVGLVNFQEILPGGLLPLPDLGVMLTSEGGAATLRLIEPQSGPVVRLRPRAACPGISALAATFLRRAAFHGVTDAEYIEDTVAEKNVEATVETAFDPASEDEIPQGARAIDLGVEWSRAFKEEAVVYRWATLPTQDMQEAEFALKGALRSALRSLSAVSRELAAEKGLDADEVLSVFEKSLRFFRKV